MCSSDLAAAGLYAALNMGVLMWLANETGKIRRREKIALGDGGNKLLARVMRGHANGIENVPMFLIMLVTAALMGMPAIAVHVLGLVFTVGRAIHATYFVSLGAPIRNRFVGFGISFLAHLVLTAGLLVHGIWRLVA